MGKQLPGESGFRLERESFLLSALAHAIILSTIMSRMGVVQFAPAENEGVAR